MSDTSVAISIRDRLAPLVTVGNALDGIDAVARHVLADEKRDAYEAAHVIATMVDTLRGYFDGKISADDTEHELYVLRQSILEAPEPPALPPAPLDAKFDGGDS